MPWVRLDDDLHLNRKIAGLSNDAFRLWTLSLTWSSREEEDGHVPEDALPFIWPTATPRARLRAQQELVEAGCWDLNGGGWVIHDFLKYNPPAAARSAKEGRQSDAGSYANHVRWHRNKGEVRSDCTWCLTPSETESESESEVDATGVRNYPPVPDPDPTLKDSHAEGLTTPRALLAAWAKLQDTKPTEKWLNHRLSSALDFIEQHPEESESRLQTFLKFAHKTGCAEPGGWPSWWPTWPESKASRSLPDCSLCENHRLVEDGDTAYTPCVCTRNGAL